MAFLYNTLEDIEKDLKKCTPLKDALVEGFYPEIGNYKIGGCKYTPKNEFATKICGIIDKICQKWGWPDPEIFKALVETEHHFEDNSKHGASHGGLCSISTSHYSDAFFQETDLSYEMNLLGGLKSLFEDFNKLSDYEEQYPDRCNGRVKGNVVLGLRAYNGGAASDTFCVIMQRVLSPGKSKTKVTAEHVNFPITIFSYLDYDSKLSDEEIKKMKIRFRRYDDGIGVSFTPEGEVTEPEGYLICNVGTIIAVLKNIDFSEIRCEGITYSGQAAAPSSTSSTSSSVSYNYTYVTSKEDQTVGTLNNSNKAPHSETNINYVSLNDFLKVVGVDEAGEAAGDTDSDVIAKTQAELDNLNQSLGKATPDTSSGTDTSPKDENGKVKTDYGNCPVCGKALKKKTHNGCCSRKCEKKLKNGETSSSSTKTTTSEKISNAIEWTNAQSSSISSTISGSVDGVTGWVGSTSTNFINSINNAKLSKKISNWIGNAANDATDWLSNASTDATDWVGSGFSNIAQCISSAFNSILNLDKILGKIQSWGIDKKISNFFKVQIANLSLKLGKLCKKCLISKNGKLYNFLADAKHNIGSIPESVAGVFKSVVKGLNSVLKTIAKLAGGFLIIYKKVYETVTNITPFLLNAETLHLGMTLKSAVSNPGKFTTSIPNQNLNDTICNVSLLEKITSYIDKIFPSLNSTDFLLPENLFKGKLALSNENLTSITKYSNYLSSFLKGPCEPLPKYDNLNFKNINYLLYLVLSWGPYGKRMFGLPFYP